MTPVDWSFIILAKKKRIQNYGIFWTFLETPNSSHKKNVQSKSFLIYLKSMAQNARNCRKKRRYPHSTLQILLVEFQFQHLTQSRFLALDEVCKIFFQYLSKSVDTEPTKSRHNFRR